MLRSLETLALMLIVAAPVGAAEGVLEINQTCAVQTGCFAGDSPGFPVSISAPGSYRLTSDLFLAQDVLHIEITSGYVTLDLQGFEVAGPVTCSGLPPSCSAVSAGEGIRVDSTVRHHVVVRNGTVRGTNGGAIGLGERATIEDVHVDDISGGGIAVGDFSTVQRTTVVSIRFTAIYLGDSSRAIDNVVVAAGFSGIQCEEGCVVSGNSVANTSNAGIDVAEGSSVRGNTVRDSLQGINASGGTLVTQNSIRGSVSTAIVANAGSLVTENVLRENQADALRCFPQTVPATTRYGNNVMTANNGTTDAVDGDQGIEHCLPLGANHCGTNLSCP